MRPIGDFVRVDPSVGRSFRGGRWDARAGLFGRDLGDERYETQLRFPDPGRISGFERTAELLGMP